MKIFILTFFIFCILLLFSSCSASQDRQIKTITPEQAQKDMEEESNIIILDVRTLEEYNTGHIKNAILIPYDEIEDTINEFSLDKNAKIYVYCRTGRRSAIAAGKLLELGFSDVTDFGGIVDWKGETEK